MITFIKTVSGEEIVGELQTESSFSMTIGTPLKLDRESMQGGEYIGFNSIIPFQIDDNIVIFKRNILFSGPVNSKAFLALYYKNISYIFDKNEKGEELLLETLEEERRILN